MSAKTDEEREELGYMYADVIRVAAGLAASGEYGMPDMIAADALAIVKACHALCFGEDE